MSERLAAVTSNSALHIIPGAGHMVHYAAPHEVVLAVDAILSGNLACNQEFAESRTRSSETGELDLATEKQA
jgi:hypothetical protein